jgi:hypothetical protein
MAEFLLMHLDKSSITYSQKFLEDSLRTTLNFFLQD